MAGGPSIQQTVTNKRRALPPPPPPPTARTPGAVTPRPQQEREGLHNKEASSVALGDRLRPEQPNELPCARATTAAMRQRARAALRGQRCRFDGNEPVMDNRQRAEIIAARGSVHRKHRQPVRLGTRCFVSNPV